MPDCTVLVVDDEQHVRSFLAAILKAQYVRVHEAGDGDEALDALKAIGGAVDLLITDIKMPRMGGIALARAVAELFPSIPVLFISGWASDPLESPEWKKPGYAFLQKPFLPRALISSVELLLGRPKAKAGVSGI